MIASKSKFDPDAPVIVVDIGNTSVSIATWCAGEVKTPLLVPTGDRAEVDKALAAHFDSIPKGKPAATVIASVVPATLELVTESLEARIDRDPLVIGDAIPLPMDVDVEDAKAIGVDRVCAAFAAYDKLQTACTIVDFGTAVTVDVVDPEGTLLGGAILPGAALQLRSLHEHTAILPAEVTPGFPALPYGRTTIEAMQTGVCRGLAGAVRGLVEAYAASLGHWPQVVATGGDLPLMGPHCDFLDTQVSHLTLRGIGLAYTAYLADCGV